ncbi:MAG: hypothetical protein AB7N76_07715 [Planctomycetota bacterium]
MAWTPWRKVGDRQSWYVDHCLRIAVCYELGVASPYDREEPEVVYVGAAESEALELERLGRGEHPAQARAEAAIARDRAIYYRAVGAPTYAQAQALRDERLAARAAPPAWG